MTIESPGRGRYRGAALLALTILLCGCDGEDPSPGAVIVPGSAEAPSHFRYSREYIFLSASGASPVIAPFAFRAADQADQLERTSQGWLARGGTWDRFLEETGVTSRVGGVWRVVPQGGLRVIAGGSAEVESLRFTRAERRLRLDLSEPTTDWNQSGETRFRLLEGELEIGSETFQGPVLELLSIERMEADLWPVTAEQDAIFLSSGDSIQLFVAESGAVETRQGFAWLRTPEGDSFWPGAEITWTGTEPLEAARRDIPNGWRFRIEEAGLEGEVSASGYDAVVGPERGGRRTLEARVSAEGYARIGERQWEVIGMVRHTQ